METTLRFTIWNTSGNAAEFFTIAREAERCGWHSMCLNEGTFQPEVQLDDVYPYSADGKRNWSSDTPFLDPLILLPAIAATTTRLHVFPFVLKLPLRDPLLLAKSVATAAVLSNNRFGLGVGMSWMPQEFRACGIDWDTRRQRFIESIEAIRLVLSGDMVEYHGEVIDFERLQARPAPTEPVPIYLGGHKPVSLRLATEFGDGWCGVPGPLDEVGPRVRRVLELLDQRGRPRTGFKIHTGVLDAKTVEDYRQIGELGITDCIVTPWMNEVWTEGLEVPTQRKLELVREFADTIIGPLSVDSQSHDTNE